MRGIFNVPQNLWALKGCETGAVYKPYPTRIESLNIRRRYYEDNTFAAEILGPWKLARPAWISRPPA